MGAGTNIWVHIGLPKCGSTSVQRHFAKHDSHYLDQGLCYPVAWRSERGYRSHRPIAQAGAGKIPQIVEAIRHEARDSSDVLISSEVLSARLPQGRLPLFVRSLNQAFGAERVRLLVYFRNVYQFVESGYAQFISRGLFKINKDRFFQAASPDMDSFVAAFQAQKGFPIYSPLGYARLIDGCFPDNRVIMKSIEREDLDGRDLVEDICETLGVRLQSEAQAQNKRVPNLVIAAAHYAQCFGSQKAYNQIKEELRKLPNRPGWDARAQAFQSAAFSISPDLHDRIRAQVDSEKAALPEFFTSGIAGLCEDRWSPPRGDSELSEEEKAEIRDLMARTRP